MKQEHSSKLFVFFILVVLVVVATTGFFSSNIFTNPIQPTNVAGQAYSYSGENPTVSRCDKLSDEFLQCANEQLVTCIAFGGSYETCFEFAEQICCYAITNTQ